MSGYDAWTIEGSESQIITVISQVLVSIQSSVDRSHFIHLLATELLSLLVCDSFARWIVGEDSYETAIVNMSNILRVFSMKQLQQFTALIERDDDGYVSLCPELDIASQGDTVEEARINLIEAIELFFEVADPKEIATRLRS